MAGWSSSTISPLSTCNTVIQTAAAAPPRSEERAHVAHLRATFVAVRCGFSLLSGCTVSCRLAYPPTQQPAHTHLVRYLLLRHRLLAHAVIELHLVRRPVESLPAFTHYVPGRHGPVAAHDLHLLVGLELHSVALHARGGAPLRARHRLGQLLRVIHRDLVDDVVLRHGRLRAALVEQHLVRRPEAAGPALAHDAARGHRAVTPHHLDLLLRLELHAVALPALPRARLRARLLGDRRRRLGGGRLVERGQLDVQRGAAKAPVRHGDVVVHAAPLDIKGIARP
mmetsp:Transcript_48782/g.117521  ORF Transcript_48782/g.117521 Transcript_48782/m.117521 type:complete len:282 (+) Transcript_48782:113-958(+)